MSMDSGRSAASCEELDTDPQDRYSSRDRCHSHDDRRPIHRISQLRSNGSKSGQFLAFLCLFLYSCIFCCFFPGIHRMVVVSGYHIDPSDFFLGAQHRPKLEIIHPDNGEVLDDTDLEIRIKLGGYEVPSSFHDSKVCIALSSGVTVAEGCFDQTPDLVFHANGLSPGQQYSLQVSFYERGKAIAVSVRNFRVAGIRGLVDGSDEPVTIMTAVQLAIQYQTRSMMQQAESIYRSILSEHPTHPNALNLLGVIFYQKGDPLAAIPYIQRAMLGNKTDEGFYNTLGECYRDLGRLDEAIDQYKSALEINPRMIMALFNMGRALQDKRKWEEAIEYYRQVQELVSLDYDMLDQGHPFQNLREDAHVRECDLLQGSRRILDAVACWKRGINLYPNNQFVYNELGNLLGQNGQYDDAYELYRVAISKGSVVAELNAAHMLELLGYHIEAVAAYDEAMANAQVRGTPQFHIQVRKAMVLPRVLPSSQSFLLELRATVESNLDMLLLADPNMIMVDNAPPLYFGYSLGYYLAFHGVDPQRNLILKSKLYRVYARMCPALLQGYFMDKTSDQMGSDDTSLSLGYEESDDISESEEIGSNSTVNGDDEPALEPVVADDTDDPKQINEDAATVRGEQNADVLPDEVPTSISQEILSEYAKKVERSSTSFELSRQQSTLQAASAVTASIATGTSTSAAGNVVNSFNLFEGSIRQPMTASAQQKNEKSPPPAPSAISPLAQSRFKSPWEDNIPHHVDKTSGEPLVRIGIASRFMQVALCSDGL
jgi:tetratricopeptide (TPR) repeat protein